MLDNIVFNKDILSAPFFVLGMFGCFGFVFWLLGPSRHKTKYYISVVGLYLLTLFFVSGGGSGYNDQERHIIKAAILLISALTALPAYLLAIVTEFIIKDSFPIALQAYFIVFVVYLGLKADTFDFDKKLVNGVIYGIPIFGLILVMVKLIT